MLLCGWVGFAQNLGVHVSVQNGVVPINKLIDTEL